jgi:hypothetical protein
MPLTMLMNMRHSKLKVFVQRKRKQVNSRSWMGPEKSIGSVLGYLACSTSSAWSLSISTTKLSLSCCEILHETGV